MILKRKSIDEKQNKREENIFYIKLLLNKIKKRNNDQKT